MKFTFNVSPNLRQPQSTKRIMFELMLGLAAVYLFALVYYYTAYGMRYALQALLLLAVAVIVALVSETVFALVLKKNVKSYLSSSFGWITAIILTMMCTIDISPYALGCGHVLQHLLRQAAVWRLRSEYLQSGRVRPRDRI